MTTSLPWIPRFVRSLALAAVAWIGSAACAPTLQPRLRPPSRELVVPGSGHHLVYSNGLSLLVVPDTTTRAVQFDVRHHVGSRDERAGEAGLAHLVEHLMFELPSAGPGSPTLMVEVEDRAAFVNAYTSVDETHYIVTGSPAELETYVLHAARRLAFSCEEIDDATFARVREIVLNELRWRREGVNTRLLAQVLEAAFPADHPYRTRVDAELDELAALTREDACAFVERHYVPARTTVVVSGNVTPEQVKSLTDAYLGSVPTAEVEPRAAVPPVEAAARRVTLEAPVGRPSALLLFPLPKRFSPEDIPAGVAVEGVRYAVQVAAAQDDSAIEAWDIDVVGGKQAPVLKVELVVDREEHLDATFDEVLDKIHAVFAFDFTTDALDRLRQERRLRIVTGVASIASRSQMYADYLEEGDEPRFVGGELAAIDALTPERVRRVGRSVFFPERAITVAIVPGAADGTEVDQADLTAVLAPEPFVGALGSRLPEDIDPADAARPEPIDGASVADVAVEVHALANGMAVVLVSSSQFPVMEARLVYGAGILHTPEQPLTAVLADSTYLLRDADGLGRQRFLLLAGGRISSNVGLSSTEFRVQGLSIYLDFLLAGLAEAHAHGTYSAQAFTRAKARALEVVEDEELERLVGPGQAYLEALYGEGHPFAPSVGDVASLRPGQVRRFHQTHYRAANAILVVTGGFDMKLALEHARGHFESPRDVPRTSYWHAPKATFAPAVPSLRTQAGRVITRVVEDKTQTDVIMGFAIPKVLGSQHAPLLVLTRMLEHELSAVREVLGASYGVHASLHFDWPRVEIQGGVDSRRAGTAVAEIHAALARVFDPTGFDRRFVHARRQALRELMVALGDPQSYGVLVATAVRHGRSVGYFRTLAQEIAAVRPEDLRTQYSRWLSKDRAVTLLEGPAAGVEDATSHNGLTDIVQLPAP